MAPILGYWNIRGLAQPIRLLLAYSDVKYEDKKYAYGPPPDFDQSSWLKEKFTLGLDFPNLPYYIDGDIKMTQSLVIMRYLAHKYGLEAKTEGEMLRADLTEQQVSDFKMGLTSMCYCKDFETLKVKYLEELPAKIKQFSEFLGKNEWFAGSKLTYVDFLMYEALDQHKILAPDCLKEYQNLSGFIERFEKLPAIEKYMKSDSFLKWPLNGDMAVFGSRSSKQP